MSSWVNLATQGLCNTWGQLFKILIWCNYYVIGTEQDSLQMLSKWRITLTDLSSDSTHFLISWMWGVLMSRFSRGPDLRPFLTTDSRYIIWWYYCTTQCTIPAHSPLWQWLKDDFLAYLDEWEASIAAVPNLTTSERTLRCLSPATLLGLRMSGTCTCTCMNTHLFACMSKAEE